MRIARIIAGTFVSTLGLFACGSTVFITDGEGGAGGSDDAAVTSGKASVNATATKSANATQVASSNTGVVSSAASGLGTCDDIGVCSGDGFTPRSGCLECSVLGDSSTALDGGACLGAFTACFGDGSFDCPGASDPQCCPYYACIESCDGNFDGQLEPGPELDCYCLNDGVQCLQMQTPGTCLGDFPNGAATASAWEVCVIDDVCPFSCG